jgi:DnaK suppressor protein
MATTVNKMDEPRHILEGKKSELLFLLRKPDGITIERSADPMDEIQYASERDLAIGNVNRESKLLREIDAALERMQDGSFGACVDCEVPISAKRLAAVPWALRCISCQESADMRVDDEAESLIKSSVSFA